MLGKRPLLLGAELVVMFGLKFLAVGVPWDTSRFAKDEISHLTLDGREIGCIVTVVPTTGLLKIALLPMCRQRARAAFLRLASVIHLISKKPLSVIAVDLREILSRQLSRTAALTVSTSLMCRALATPLWHGP
jgi:hypothetical protein